MRDSIKGLLETKKYSLYFSISVQVVKPVVHSSIVMDLPVKMPSREMGQ